MVAGKWDGVASLHALAAEWGVPLTLAAEYARDARRLLRQSGSDQREENVAEHVAGLQSIKRSALEQPRPDFRAALSACEQIATVLGLNAPKRIEAAIVHDVTDPAIAAAKHEALARALREQMPEESAPQLAEVNDD